MPLNYGSKTILSPLSSSSVNVNLKDKPHKNVMRGWWSFLRIAASLVEVGVGFVFTGPVGATAIGIAGFGAQEGIDAATGNLNIKNSLLNAGLGLLPGAVSLGKTLTKTGQAVSKFAKLSELDKSVINKVLNKGAKFPGKATKEGEIFKKVFKNFKAGEAIRSPKKILKITNGGVRTAVAGEAVGDAWQDTEKIIKGLSTLDREIAIRMFSKSNTFLGRNLEKFLVKNLRKMSQKGRNLLFNSALEHLESVIKFDFKSRWARFYKWVSSASFNDKVSQRMQLIDPKDLFRAPIEAGYKKLNRYINKRIIKKTLLKAKSLEDAFVKAGGVLVNSTVILGYKIIIDVPGYKTVMIKFNKDATGSRKGKNVGGKKAVIIKATDYQLEMLRENGMNYYLRTWAISKGGNMPTGLARDVSLFLAFVPIAAIKNIATIISNWVENLASMGNGTYFSTYFSSGLKSAWHTAQTRVGRLITRVGVGSLVRSHFGAAAGKWVGRESSKVMSSFNVGIRAAMNGKSFNKAFNKSIKMGVAKSIQSGVKRKARKKGNVQAALIGGKRRLGIVGGLGSTFVPGRVKW